MKRIPILLLLMLAASAEALAQSATPPKLIIQIVVSSMRADALDRYMPNFEQGGFRRLVAEGARFENAAYAYHQTLTPTSLATLTTGLQPSIHGVVATQWLNYVSNVHEDLIRDVSVHGLEYYGHDNLDGYYSPRKLPVKNFAEDLLLARPRSQVVSLAPDPLSAIVMGGQAGLCFWMEGEKCYWRSSSYYMPELPAWVKQYNREGVAQAAIKYRWNTMLPADRYLNRRRADIVLTGKTAENIKTVEGIPALTKKHDRIRYTPAGNHATLAFAKEAITRLDLGRDDETDLLNICLDGARYITEAYGPESIEVEDMYYRLDYDLSDFLNFAVSQTGGEEHLLVVLTSDHGSSSACDLGAREIPRLNTLQFETIINSFLSARYGQGRWVEKYGEHALWLNHNLIYEKNLSLEALQNDVAAFALQFDGVSHAMTATALRSGAFTDGVGRLMQNGFYPRRSGDVLLSFVPGAIEQRDRCRSASGSLYAYDRRVPLLFFGHKVPHTRINRPVDMTAVAPTIAALSGIAAPDACEALPIQEITIAE